MVLSLNAQSFDGGGWRSVRTAGVGASNEAMDTISEKLGREGRAVLQRPKPRNLSAVMAGLKPRPIKLSGISFVAFVEPQIPRRPKGGLCRDDDVREVSSRRRLWWQPLWWLVATVVVAKFEAAFCCLGARGRLR